MVVSLCTSCLNPQETSPVLISVKRLSWPWAMVWLEGPPSETEPDFLACSGASSNCTTTYPLSWTYLMVSFLLSRCLRKLYLNFINTTYSRTVNIFCIFFFLLLLLPLSHYSLISLDHLSYAPQFLFNF